MNQNLPADEPLAPIIDEKILEKIKKEDALIDLIAREMVQKDLTEEATNKIEEVAVHHDCGESKTRNKTDPV